MPTFLHEKLPIYQKALALSIKIDAIAQRLPRERWSLKDGLWRCSTSMPFNIAEATGGLTSNHRINHFRIARGSAAETSSVFDYIVGVGLMRKDEMFYEELYEVAGEIGRMIYPHRK